MLSMRRKFIIPLHRSLHKITVLTHCFRADGSKTLAMYQEAAANASTVAPSKVQGLVQGTLSSSTTSSTSSITSASASSIPTKNAGVEARGGVRWTALGLTGVVAAGIGGLII